MNPSLMTLSLSAELSAMKLKVTMTQARSPPVRFCTTTVVPIHDHLHKTVQFVWVWLQAS
jgi:hypothetical protein